MGAAVLGARRRSGSPVAFDSFLWWLVYEFVCRRRRRGRHHGDPPRQKKYSKGNLLLWKGAELTTVEYSEHTQMVALFTRPKQRRGYYMADNVNLMEYGFQRASAYIV